MLDPQLLDTFRARVANPVYWRRTHRILRSYNRYALATVEGAGALVDEMCVALNVRLHPYARAQAARWLVAQRLDPQNPRDHWRMWRFVYPWR